MSCSSRGRCCCSSRGCCSPTRSGARVPLSPRVVALLFGIGLAAVFATPLIYLAFDVTSVEHHRLQTWLMRFGGGLAIAPVAAAVIWSLVARRRRAGALPAPVQRPLAAALVTSLALFGIGGLIGFAIHGSNVKIPAHYHGAIVGVTIAAMGIAYWLLPRFGFAAPPSRLATWQIYLYGGGQLLHITGLVWSGGYGVQRKVADGAIVERSLEQTLGHGHDGPRRSRRDRGRHAVRRRGDRGDRQAPACARGGIVRCLTRW